MNPILKRVSDFPVFHEGGCISRQSAGARASPAFSESSIEEEAAVLLSIAKICDREVKSEGGFDAIFSNDMPTFPSLFGPRSTTMDDISHLKPRSESLFRDPQLQYEALRARAVSIDTPGAMASTKNMDRLNAASPILVPGTAASSSCPALVSPVTPHTTVRRLPLRKQSQRAAKLIHQEPVVDNDDDDDDDEMEAETHRTPVSSKDKKGRTLQPNPPKGVPIKMIGRKKFSWKCYPELEQFLIANREEYLRHSALNYTVQQKQYNNSLTDELLDLATRHGYLFDTSEFSFVTVRDRIRCYYKSYVQSAKKRGVLMGYAARKAGLLNEDDLAGEAKIVTSI